ncbi:DUF3883 domain-containing protein [Micromonospora sp. WMMD882]|uniref:DUF3883 domain-containing protein n=1 Tax=Micromonospora sp. WMMD882 TaxID=3015151 RepID=UPI00248B3265|nr:DUF3883 domain-containing protein [Micromonospora sp. WMMD882]WBB77754.1 DUF3883 domain-containing protein [Micromonospora sp. WMMD882]
MFLLCHSARLSARRDVDEWVRAARAQGSYLAAATDLLAPAQRLLDEGLAAQAESIVLAPALAGIAGIADRATLCNIARVLIITDPPAWLRIAVSPNGVAREYIPTADLHALQWLDPELDTLLTDVRREVSESHDAELRKRIGDAAEAVVMAALRRSGQDPSHVALISDAFGYDIEVSSPRKQRIEVKGCGTRSRGSFHLTRNEYEKSRLYGAEWVLVQVVFASNAFVAPKIDSGHVVGIFEICAADVASAVPPDTPEFVWTDSAVVTPSREAWHRSAESVAEDFELPGLAFS